MNFKDWTEAVVLVEGETVKVTHRSTKGFMGETDVIEAEVRDLAGIVTSRVDVTDHTAVRGGGQTVWIRQVAVDGRLIVEKYL